MHTVKLSITLEHPSIVQFLGAAWTNKTDLQALYEYMPGGDLQSYVASTRDTPTEWDAHKLRLAMDIVEALVCTCTRLARRYCIAITRLVLCS